MSSMLGSLLDALSIESSVPAEYQEGGSISAEYREGQEIDILDLNNDIALLIGSHLAATDLLRVALSCRRFGAKLEQHEGRSLMEEVAMRQLTENATQQQIDCIPRMRGESWIGLYALPNKMENWKILNNKYAATGSRRDRAILMQQMARGDLQLGWNPAFDCAKYDLGEVMNRLAIKHGLFVLAMEGDGEEGVSSGYYWPRTRGILMKEKMFRDALVDLEQKVDIHHGVVSFRMFDWAYNDGECVGEFRIIVPIYPGKKMRFTDGIRGCTLTLPHAAFLALSKHAEKLVEKVSPPYDVEVPNADGGNIIPKTDTNEPASAFFLILDVSLKDEEGP